MLKNRTNLLLLFLIILIAFFLRTPGLFTCNRLFLFDTARDMLYVQKIVQQHDILLIGPSSGGLQGYFHGVLWYYLLAIPFIITNGHPLATTAFAIVMSMLSIIAVWWVMKKYTGGPIALCAALVWAVANFSIQSTYFSWNPYMIVWLMPIYFFAILSALNQKKYGLPIMALCVGLFIHFEAIYGITQLVPLLFIAVYTLRNKTTPKIKILFITSVGFIIPFLPYILFDLRHDFLITKTLTQTLTSGGDTITTRSDLFIDNPLQRIAIRSVDWLTYTFNFSIYPWLNNLLALSVLVLFIIQTRQKTHRTMILVITLSLITPWLLFINYRHAVWSYYWIGNAPFLSLSVFYLFHHTVQSPLIRKSLYTAVSTYAFFTTINIIPNWLTGPLEPGPDNFLTQQKTAHTILNEFGTSPYSVYVHTPPVYDYKYRYVIEWLSMQQNQQPPQDDKQGLYALILEPSSSDPVGEYFKQNQIKTISSPYKTEHIDGISIEFYQKQVGEENIDMNILPTR